MSQAVHAAKAWLGSGAQARLHADVRMLRDAAGCITRLTAGVPPQAGDSRCGLLLPRLPNLHSHAFQRAIVGFTEVAGHGGDDFWSWREQMYRVALDLDPETFQALAERVYRELRAGGYDTVCEFHYLHHDRDGRPYADPGELSHRLVAAARAAGIRLCLLPVLYCHSGFGGEPPRAEQRRFVHGLEAYLKLVTSLRDRYAGASDVAVGIAAHSLRAVDPDTLARLAVWRRSVDPGMPFHVHVSEQAAEVTQCLERFGTTPIRLLADHAGLDAGVCLVHATHATAEELRLIAQAGAVVALCPTTEANLGDGLFPLPDFQSLGGRWGVGSDSQVCRDAFSELRLAEYGQRLLRRQRCVLAAPGQSTGEALLRAAADEHSAVTGFPSGLLEAGRWANPLCAQTEAGVDAVIFDEGSGPVRG